MTAAGRLPVALVLVSHSARLAEGAVELAGQMAPGILLLPVGGDDTGGLGTSFDRVQAALEQAAGEAGAVVVLADLGSAVLTTEAVLEALDPQVAERVTIAHAPFVEGAVAAAVRAAGGAGAPEVLAAARAAGAGFAPAAAGGGLAVAGAVAGSSAAVGDGAAQAEVVVRNPLGLHARPAAVLARLAAGLDARVTIDGVDATSVLGLMQMGATQGRRLRVEATGPAAEEAVRAVTEAIGSGFGEA